MRGICCICRKDESQLQVVCEGCLTKLEEAMPYANGLKKEFLADLLGFNYARDPEKQIIELREKWEGRLK